MSNVQEEVYAWKGLGKDGPGPTFSFYSDGTLRVTLADGKGTITLDPTGNVIADPVDGTVQGFGGGSGTEISGSGGTVDAAAVGGVTATLSAGKRWTFDLADADPSVVLRGAPASNGVQVEFRNIADDALLGRVFADASDVVLLRRSANGLVDTAKLYLDVTGEVGLQNRVDGSDITLAAGGDILINVASGKKLGVFGAAGATKQTVTGATAAAIAASLVTALAAYGVVTDGTG